MTSVIIFTRCWTTNLNYWLTQGWQYNSQERHLRVEWGRMDILLIFRLEFCAKYKCPYIPTGLLLWARWNIPMKHSYYLHGVLSGHCVLCQLGWKELVNRYKQHIKGLTCHSLVVSFNLFTTTVVDTQYKRVQSTLVIGKGYYTFLDSLKSAYTWPKQPL